VELSVTFIQPGTGRLVAEGRCLRSGKSLSFSEGEVRDGQGNLVAKALGTFSLRHGAKGDVVLPPDERG
jgi:acyl-coenzyme A thioesterase PaaI-like protein